MHKMHKQIRQISRYDMSAMFHRLIKIKKIPNPGTIEYTEFNIILVLGTQYQEDYIISYIKELTKIVKNKSP